MSSIFDVKAPTPHIGATRGQIAKIVLMAGDPLRAKNFAYKYLEGVKLISEIRNMYIFTGTFNKKKVTVMGHGMGMASIGIYAYELYKFYDVETIIRFGSCGSYNPDYNLFDIVIGKSSYTTSNYGKAFGYKKNIVDAPASDLLEKINWIIKQEKDEELKSKLHYTCIHASDWFYAEKNKVNIEKMVKKGVSVVEMESYALYVIAKYLNRQALTILSISDNIAKGETVSSVDREKNFLLMFEFLSKILKVL